MLRLKQLSRLFFKIVYIFVSVRIITDLVFFRDRLYTLWLRNCFNSVGNGLLIHKGINVIGGKNIIIGSNTSINKGCTLSSWAKRFGQIFDSNITIGNNCSIGEYNHITSINSITIGNGVLTGRWVTITDNSHGESTITDLKQAPIQRSVISKGPVKIENNVWIGDKATILPGVTIGEGTVIAANAVVTKSLPPYCIAAGSPARIIKQIEQNQCQNLE